MTFPSDLIEKWLLQADEIERLRAALEENLKHVLLADAENERLQAALERIADLAKYTAPENIPARLNNEVQCYAIAREALREVGDE